MTRLLAIFAALTLAGCGATGPKRVTTGGTASASTATTQTAVAPTYPPSYPSRAVVVVGPATQPSSDYLPLATASIADISFYPPTPPTPPTVLTATTAMTARTEASTSIDIVPPKSWGGYWIGLCLTIAAACAVAATVTPVKRLYVVAIAAAALASLALVPPAYLGVSLLAVVAVLVATVAALAWRAGLWRLATVQVVRGVDEVKSEMGHEDEINKTLAAEQDEPVKRLVRKARGK